MLTAHFVVKELSQRGIEVRHLHFWDDWDRLRKLPYGVPLGWEQYLGQGLMDIPDFCSEHSSYAEHWKAEFREALKELNIETEEISQGEIYKKGMYDKEIGIALSKREEIFDILLANQSSKRAEEKKEQRGEFWPYRPYCEKCGKDGTTIGSMYEDGIHLSYNCRSCGYFGVERLGRGALGKLSWKVDWPMRWVHWGVDFEPGGEDHGTPGSSYSVGKEIAPKIFSGKAPIFLGYSFVGVAGAATKMSSSSGNAITPAKALEILEPEMLLWLYAKREPSAGFEIDFSVNGILRLYEEWDQFQSKAEKGEEEEKRLAERIIFQGEKGKGGKVRASFRLLFSTADMTQGNKELMLSVIEPYLGKDVGEKELEPRLSLSVNYARDWLPTEERTIINSKPDFERGQNAEAGFKREVNWLLEKLPKVYGDVEKMTALIYGVPKLELGLDIDAPPTKEVKIAQRKFFAELYFMLVGRDTGPRLPTLMLSIGLGKVQELLSPCLNKERQNQL